MNLFSATVETVKRLTARHRTARIEKRTYVFVLVPVDFHRNGHATRAQVEQPLIENKPEAKDAWLQTLTALPSFDGADHGGAIDQRAEPELNYALRWTWFLPNPLWPPRKLK